MSVFVACVTYSPLLTALILYRASAHCTCIISHAWVELFTVTLKLYIAHFRLCSVLSNLTKHMNEHKFVCVPCIGSKIVRTRSAHGWMFMGCDVMNVYNIMR